MYLPTDGTGGRKDVVMIVKKLTRLGNSSALVVDRTLMQLMDIDADTPLKVTVEGRRMTVEPLDEKERAARFEKVMKKTGKKNAELFRRLSK
jgi:antitoxin MazE